MKQQSYKTLFVGGKFDVSGGRPSKIADIVWKNVTDNAVNGVTEYHNGGHISELERIAAKVDQENSYVAFWFPDVPNDAPKLIRKIKENRRKCVLVSSKRNDSKYGLADIIAHGLKNHSNLMVEMQKRNDSYFCRVIDPLGNVFYDGNDFAKAGSVIKKRADELLDYTRAGSISVGTIVIDQAKADDTFLEKVKDYADRFHEILQDVTSSERFLGNASYRCESGFPSFRSGNQIYVSQRNLDKRGISSENFVACRDRMSVDNLTREKCVEYFGEKKPSVDTPIHINLYESFPNINYMIHGHVYIEGAPMIKGLVPCGAVEESDEVKNIVQDKNTDFFAVNLRGHGRLVGASLPEKLSGVKLVGRPFPEDQRWEYDR